MQAISDELRRFMESGLEVSVGTRAADLVPQAVRGWGTRVSSDGRSVEVFLDGPSAGEAVANLRDNGRIAVVLSHMATNRSVQLKGRCSEVGEAVPGDWEAIERHRRAFTEICEKAGFAAQVVSNLWSAQVVKVRFEVDDIFDQTPGPGAGQPI